MNEKDIISIQTTKGELRYFRDWENWEGGINMINPVTVKRYREIKDMHPNAEKCGVFFAFSNNQFREGYDHLIELGHIKKGDKVVRTDMGMFGTKEGIDKFLSFYEDRGKNIVSECDPQEVYFYEYNDHESMIAWDGDLEAIKIIIDLWGADVARKIKRYNASESIENLVCKPIEKSGLYFLNDREKETPNSVWFSNTETGLCYTMYGGALYPVYDADGKTYAMPELAGVSAYYDGKKLYKFHME